MKFKKKFKDLKAKITRTGFENVKFEWNIEPKSPGSFKNYKISRFIVRVSKDNVAFESYPMDTYPLQTCRFYCQFYFIVNRHFFIHFFCLNS